MRAASRHAAIVGGILTIALTLTGIHAGSVLGSPQTPPSFQIGAGTPCGDEREATTVADNAGHVYAVWSDYCTDHAYLYMQVSSDGGQTFGGPKALLSTHTFDGSTYVSEDDPSVYVDSSVSPPAVYVAFVATTNFTTRTPENVYVVRSTDYGSSFSYLNGGFKLNRVTGGTNGSNSNAASASCSAATPGECRRPVVLARGTNVFVAYSYVSRSTTTTGARFFQTSTNGGTTFAETRQVTGNNRAPIAEGGVIAANGDAWVAWADVTTRDFVGTGGTGADYYVSRTPAGTMSKTSTTSASIYTSPIAVQCLPAVSAGCVAGWYAPQADIAIDAGNKLYLAFQDGQSHATANSPSVIKLGACALTTATACTTVANWTAFASTARVDDKDLSGDLTHCGGTVAANTAKCMAAFPQLVAGAADTVGVSWADDRNGSACTFNHGCGWNMWYRSSTTGLGGFTSPGIQLNDHGPVAPSSDATGFKFFDGGVGGATTLFYHGGFSGLSSNPACPSSVVADWAEAADRTGGATNGGRVFAKSTVNGPVSPASLSATPVAGKVALSWPASSSAGVTGYRLYRGTGSNGDNLTVLATVGNDTSYDDATVSDGSRYTYAVSALIDDSEGCQSLRSTAAFGVTQYSLGVTTDQGQVPASNLSIKPASLDGKYDAGTVVTITAATPVSTGVGQQFRFDHWIGGASGTSTSVSVTMNTDTNVTASYRKQWSVTFQESGIPCTTSASVSRTVSASPNGAIESGNTATFTTTAAHGFSAGQTVVVLGVGGTNPANPLVLGYNGTWTIDSIVSTTKFTVTLPAANLPASGAGTAVSVVRDCDTGGATLVTGDCPKWSAPDLFFSGGPALWVDDGSSLSYSHQPSVPTSTNPNKRYRLSGVSGPASGQPITAASTVTATYVAQYKVTFSQTGIGGDTGANGVVTATSPSPPVVTTLSVGGGAGTTALPSTQFWDVGTTYAFSGSVASISFPGKHYDLTGSVSGVVAPASAGTTITGAYIRVKGEQTISGFGPIANRAFGAPDFTITGVTGGASGNPVVFTGGPGTVCTVNGNTVHLVGGGTCTLHANQAGDADNYNAAPQVDQSFSVGGQATKVTLVSVLPGSVQGGRKATFKSKVTAGGVKTVGLTVEFWSDQVGGSGTLIGTATVNAKKIAKAKLTVSLPAGGHTIYAHVAATGNFGAGTSSGKPLTVT